MPADNSYHYIEALPAVQQGQALCPEKKSMFQEIS